MDSVYRGVGRPVLTGEFPAACDSFEGVPSALEPPGGRASGTARTIDGKRDSTSSSGIRGASATRGTNGGATDRPTAISAGWRSTSARAVVRGTRGPAESRVVAAVPRAVRHLSACGRGQRHGIAVAPSGAEPSLRSGRHSCSWASSSGEARGTESCTGTEFGVRSRTRTPRTARSRYRYASGPRRACTRTTRAWGVSPDLCPRPRPYRRIFLG